jgi:flagellar export protein FliJ
MKKFSFSLQPLLKVKGIQEKQKKAELAEIQRLLAELYAQQAELNRQFDDSRLRYGRDMRNGMPLPQMAWHVNYADYLQAQLKALLLRIAETEQKKEIKQTELLALRKELRTIDKLRDEQYRAYLQEVLKEEEKVLGDLISYNKSIKTAD